MNFNEFHDPYKVNFMIPTKPQSEVWAVTDYCSWECEGEGTLVVALFDKEQIAKQFKEARNYAGVQRMDVYHAMRGLD